VIASNGLAPEKLALKDRGQNSSDPPAGMRVADGGDGAKAAQNAEEARS
jgi:hypothetical protein